MLTEKSPSPPGRSKIASICHKRSGCGPGFENTSRRQGFDGGGDSCNSDQPSRPSCCSISGSAVPSRWANGSGSETTRLVISAATNKSQRCAISAGVRNTCVKLKPPSISQPSSLTHSSASFAAAAPRLEACKPISSEPGTEMKHPPPDMYTALNLLRAPRLAVCPPQIWSSVPRCTHCKQPQIWSSALCKERRLRAVKP
mmetsp:Transcript_116908/g.342354  ORF Transcript_116908/g.342354 Transcript_116908/m.342354 type:complete len:200 (+) Transcript_116908:367-966(+)